MKGDFRVWHNSEMPARLGDVRYRGQPGRHVLALSLTGFDPNRTKVLPVSRPKFRIAADCRRTGRCAKRLVEQTALHLDRSCP
jgi:hypothetical protein